MEEWLGRKHAFSTHARKTRMQTFRARTPCTHARTPFTHSCRHVLHVCTPSMHPVHSRTRAFHLQTRVFFNTELSQGSVIINYCLLLLLNA